MVKPEDVVILTDEEQIKYNNLESMIDQLLIQKQGHAWISNYSINDSKGLNVNMLKGQAWKRLKLEYEKNGWAIETKFGESFGDFSYYIHPKDTK